MMRSSRKVEINRLVELTNVGATRAAEAFAQLVGTPIQIVDSVVLEGESGIRCDVVSGDVAEWSTGVFFEFDGCLDAIVGILFPSASSEALIRRIVGIDSGELEPTIIESALMEVGNILASHVASGIADALESRLLPSIPSLAMAGAEQAFEDLIDRVIGAGALRIESALHDEAGMRRGRLVLVPTRLDSI
jgi:chemotaxis protein CheY-P-specific phosphatase CheC